MSELVATWRAEITFYEILTPARLPSNWGALRFGKFCSPIHLLSNEQGARLESIESYELLQKLAKPVSIKVDCYLPEAIGWAKYFLAFTFMGSLAISSWVGRIIYSSVSARGAHQWL